MDKQAVGLEPQIIQFGQHHKQLIKVTNRTNESIQNCFFCLFNTNKYEFEPQSFSLQPKQHKLVQVTLKIKTMDGPIKQFAYMKFKNVNKRITLMNVAAPQPTVQQYKLLSPQSGTQDLNTLSSREYRENQKTAYDRLIAQKQAYIQRLQRRLQEQESGRKSRVYDEVNQLQMKVDLLMKQKQQLIIENIELQSRFTELRILTEADTKATQLNLVIADKMREIATQAQQIKYLQHQCQQYLNKIADKQIKLRQNQLYYVQKIDHIIKEGQKRMQQMEDKMGEEKKETERLSKNIESKLSDKYRNQIKQLENEIQSKQKQITSLSARLQTNRKSFDKQEETKNKMLLQNSRLVQQTQELKDKLKQQNKTLSNLKEQIIQYQTYKQNQDESSLKMSRVLQMGMQSCKKQNQLLRKNNQQLQKSIIEQTKNRKNYENKANKLQQFISDLQKQIKQQKQQNQIILAEKNKQSQQSHDKLMNLKSENIQLIQKMNIQKRRQDMKQQQLQQLRAILKEKELKHQQKQGKYKKLIQKYQDNLKCYEQQLENSKKKINQLKQKLHEVQLAKQKITRKIQKYKRQTKKQINQIKDIAKDDLIRIEKQKNKLYEKVEQLQISAQQTQLSNNEESHSRNKTRTFHEANNAQNQNKKTKYPMSHQGDMQNKKTGIKNQRRQLEESQINSRTQIDMDKVYGELGQLRQYKNYINNYMKKIRNMPNLRGSFTYCLDENFNQNPIFDVINFFKDIQSKLGATENSKNLLQAEKQIHFLKGRLTELQPLLKNLKNKSNKDNQQQISHTKSGYDVNAIEFLRQQMKSQYKKLYDALNLSQEANKILKTKIYQQYRSRIIDLIAKKDRDEYTVCRIESVLQRFVDGLGNMSHKQAVLAKQVKLKYEARKDVSLLKSKLANANKSIQNATNKKTMTCVRELTKGFDFQDNSQWIDNIKNEARMLTLQAQNARLLEEVSVHQTKASQSQQQLARCEVDLRIKQTQIDKLKKQVIFIAHQNQFDKQKYEQQIIQLKRKYTDVQKMEKEISTLTNKQKQYNHMKQQIQQKRQQIKKLRENQKLLERLLDQSKRNQSTIRQKQRKEYLQQSRMQQSLRELKQSNRQLRSENIRLKQQIDGLIQEANKKNATLKRLKSQGEQFRIKQVKGDQQSLQKMKIQIRQLKQQIKRVKQDSEKSKRKKQKQLLQKQSQFTRITNQHSIEKSSLESIIRALMDTLSGIYCSLDILARKKGSIVSQSPNFDELFKNPSQIRSTKIRQYFEDIIESLKQ